MITIVNPSSRPGGRSAVVASTYKSILDEIGEPSCILNLSEFTPAMIDAIYYTFAEDKKGFDVLQQIVDKSEKFVFILPEYNGSFPRLLSQIERATCRE